MILPIFTIKIHLRFIRQGAQSIIQLGANYTISKVLNFRGFEPEIIETPIELLPHQVMP